MKEHLLLAVGLALGLALLVLMAFAPPHSGSALAAPVATVRYVLDNGGADAGNCADPQAPCRTVQYALGQADHGVTIQVGSKDYAAIYTGTIVITRSVTLEGGWDVTSSGGPLVWNRNYPCQAFSTTLDAQGTGRVISITGNTTPTIDCFTITGGDATGLGGGLFANDAGGGIYSRDAAPLIANNVITANYGCTGTCSTGGGYGGGIYMLNAPATAVITNNLIANNVADGPGGPISGRGGGVMLRNSDAQVLSNTIEYNLAGDAGGLGGGIAVFNGSPTIARNDILVNHAGQAIVCLGGGLYVRSSTPVTVEHNLFQNNLALNTASPGTTAQGGGLHYDGNSNGQAIIHDNVFRWNHAAPASAAVSEGGGLYLTGLSAPSSVSSNTIQGNYANWSADGYGGGIYVDSSEVTIAGNHIFSNKGSNSGPLGAGGGIYATGSSVLIQSNAITSNGNIILATSPVIGIGGGMVISDSVATVRDNWIENNTALGPAYQGEGGGIYAYSSTLQIEDNTIANNRATHDVPGNGLGSGVFIAQSPAATLSDNHIYGNVNSDKGAGVYIAASDGATLTHNQIHDNKHGGGVHLLDSDNAVLTDNGIYSNTTVWGSGVWLFDSDSVEMVGNSIYSNTAGLGGGGLYLLNSESVTLTGNSIHNNTANNGGGIYLDASDDATLRDNYVCDNESGASGGGLYFLTSKNAALVNTMIANNHLTGSDSGAGVFLSINTTARFEHTTLARNSGGQGEGIYLDIGATAWMTNTIVASHTVGVYVDTGCAVALEATLWGDGAWANGTDWDGGGSFASGTVGISGNPAFVDPDQGNYHVGPGSDAIDAGLDVGVTTDIDGDPRLGTPDLGADEWVFKVFLPLVLR